MSANELKRVAFVYNIQKDSKSIKWYFFASSHLTFESHLIEKTK